MAKMSVLEEAWRMARRSFFSNAPDDVVAVLRDAFYTGAKTMEMALVSDDGRSLTDSLLPIIRRELRAYERALKDEHVQKASTPPDQSLGDAPNEERYRNKLIGAMQGLDLIFNGAAKGADRAVGLVLLLFPFGERDGRCNYISNGADRRDIAVLFREQARRFEGAADPGVGHG